MHPTTGKKINLSGQNAVLGSSTAAIRLRIVTSIFVMLAALPSSQFFCLPPMPPDGATAVPPPRHKPDTAESRQGENRNAVCTFKSPCSCDVTCIVALCILRSGIRSEGDDGL